MINHPDYDDALTFLDDDEISCLTQLEIEQEEERTNPELYYGVWGMF